jgi:hypothetical protein
MTDFYRSLYMRQIRNIAFFSITGHITALLFFKEFRVNQCKKLWRRAGKVFSVQVRSHRFVIE